MDAIKEVIDQAYDEDLEERTVTNGELSRSDIWRMSIWRIEMGMEEGPMDAAC